MGKIAKSWFAISGALDPIDYDGPSFFRFPAALAEAVIETYTTDGDWVLDPFYGFGTTLVAAQRLRRRAIGFEKDEERARFARGRVSPPTAVIRDDARNAAAHRLPPFDLLLTSPPYSSFRTFDAEGEAHYFDDLRGIFAGLKRVLKADATIVVNVSNIRRAGGVQTLAWDVARELARLFAFRGEIVRCNTDVSDGLGYDHDYLLVFTNA